MQIGFLSTKPTNGFISDLEKLLGRKGHEIVCSLQLSEEADFADALNYTAMQCQALIYYGNRDKLFDTLKNDYEVDAALSVFELNDTLYAVMDEYSREFVTENVIPMLNSRCKTLYTTDIFKTFGHSEEELRELLKNYIKNRSRIVFSFYPSVCECEIDVRYSSKMSHDTVNTLIAGVRDVVRDYTYAGSDISLAQCVMNLLKTYKKRVCIAESFTGGAITSELTLCTGASEFVCEGIVSYTNESKMRRLGVNSYTIDTWGAVSPDTVYEMAVNILRQNNCDICLATTGNAGPTAEKDGEVGRCYIAVGDAQGIHIFEHNFQGDRNHITQCGVKYALYYLYKQLKSLESAGTAGSEYNKEQ